MESTLTVLDYQLQSIKAAQHKVAIRNTKDLILSNRNDLNKIKKIKEVLGVNYVNSVIDDLITNLEDLKNG